MNNRAKETLAAVVPTGTVIGIINLPEVQAFATILLTVLNCAYLIWLWQRQANKKDK